MRVLIIEGEERLVRSIYRHIAHENYSCDVAFNIADGRRMIESFNYDCILLDMDLSNSHGLALLKEIRRNKKHTGIIVISQKSAVEDKIASLKLGADDYLTKPIHLDELSARIGAIIRRWSLNDDHEIVFGELKLNTLKRMAVVADKEIQLTRKEYEILYLLIAHNNRVVSKEEIAKRLSGQADIFLYNFDTLYAHVKNLKKKLLSAGR
ncbi:MAG: response regulator transcription factor, partial [Niabella sp.]